MEGLLIAMQNLDKIVTTIRAAKDGSAAAVKLQQDFGMSQEQVCTPYRPAQLHPDLYNLSYGALHHGKYVGFKDGFRVAGCGFRVLAVAVFCGF